MANEVIILAKNILADYAPTLLNVVSQKGGFPVTNIYDYKPYTKWMPQYQLTFTSGGTYEVEVGDVIEGATSGATATVTQIDVQSGSWAGGNALGQLYITGQVGTFQSENLDVGVNLNVATISQDSFISTLIDMDFDLGEDVTVNSFAVVGHNFGTTTVTVSIYHDNVPNFATGTFVGNKTFTLDDPSYQVLTAGTDRYWRVRISSSTVDTFLGYIALGEKMIMETAPEYGYDPDGQQAIIRELVSEGGEFLGGTKKYVERDIEARFERLTASFVEEDLIPFLEDHYIEKHPWFYIDKFSYHDGKVLFLRAPGDPSIDLPYVPDKYREWTMRAIGLRRSKFRV